MEFSVHSLASGSSGNSILVRGGSTNILLDAGICDLQLKKRLAKLRLTQRDISAVFITHEHQDHCSGAYVISSRFQTRIIANPETLSALSIRKDLSHTSILETGSLMQVGDLAVQSFSVSHDAVAPVGYSVMMGNRKISFITDTGKLVSSMASYTEGSDLLIVEANHDEKRLMDGPYPASLKARVLGEKGHLSNEDASQLAVELAQKSTGCRSVWLTHLSRINNSPKIARRHVQRRLSEAGCRNVILDVVPWSGAGLSWSAS